MSQEEVIKVTAAVIIEDGRVLIAQRPPGGRHHGAWEFPGGKVEPGESPEECLARELAEELGVAVAVGERLTEVRHAYPDLLIVLAAFACEITAGEPRDIHCSAHAWVSPAELLEYDLLPPDLEIAHTLRLHPHGPLSNERATGVTAIEE